MLSTVRYPTEGLPDFQADFAGDVLTVEFELGGFRFVGINAGAEFRPNPALSFFVNVDAASPDAVDQIDALWDALGDGGTALMPLQGNPFSERFGWMQDRYGVSWQLMLVGTDGAPRPFITPSLMFTAGVQERAREAMQHYVDVFGGSIGEVQLYPEGGPMAGQVMVADFELLGQRFVAMDSAPHTFTFTPGVSLQVDCHGQAELDRWWEQLSAVPDAEQCGWLVDRFGVSWQLVPDNLGELMAKPDAYAKLMSECIDLLRDRPQLIFYGPPGTGNVHRAAPRGSLGRRQCAVGPVPPGLFVRRLLRGLSPPGRRRLQAQARPAAQGRGRRSRQSVDALLPDH